MAASASKAIIDDDRAGASDSASVDVQSAISMLQVELKVGDMTELKALKSPPKPVCMAGEAVCILFGVEPSWNQFKHLAANTRQLIASAVAYDTGNVSKEMLRKLKPLVNDERWTPEHMKNCSVAVMLLSIWVQSIYDYASQNNQK